MNFKIIGSTKCKGILADDTKLHIEKFYMLYRVTVGQLKLKVIAEELFYTISIIIKGLKLEQVLKLMGHYLGLI